MDKLLEALKKTSLNEEQLGEVSKSVEEMIKEAIQQVEANKQAEYDRLVAEAYDKAQAEIDGIESKALEGYQQAHDVIQDMQLRIDTLEREYENKMEEGYQQAWEMLEAEQKKNESLELEVMKEADQNLVEMRDFIVEKLDLFLQMQKAEVYDEARRDILNDPKMVEHRVAIEKMAEIMSDYLSTEELAGVSSKHIAEAQRTIEDLQGRLKILETKTVHQSRQIHSLKESVQTKEQQLTEATNKLSETERNERKNDSGKVSGRGQRVLNEGGESIIPEFNGTNNKKEKEVISESQLVEDMLVLSGIAQSK